MRERTAITIGSLDGVHRGHAALLQAARAAVGPRTPSAGGEGRAGGRVVALVFDPHPMSILRPGHEPPRLTTWAQREALLREAGADVVERLHPTPELLGQSPAAFIAGVVAKWSPTVLVEGPDFHFGKARAGTPRVLAHLGQDLGFASMILAPKEAVLSDHAVVRCSSTLVRWLVQHGRVDDAGAVLGRPYELEGSVERGDQRGRTIGFPTANVRCPQVLPADGVYAATALLPDGQEMPAAVNVGARPTFNGAERRVEAHVLLPGAARGAGASEHRASWRPLPGVPEYGWTLRLRLRAFVRDQVRFESAGALVAQLGRDIDRVRSLVRAAVASTPPQEAAR